jgi:hypothetical protein
MPTFFEPGSRCSGVQAERLCVEFVSGGGRVGGWVGVGLKRPFVVDCTFTTQGLPLAVHSLGMVWTCVVLGCCFAAELQPVDATLGALHVGRTAAAALDTCLSVMCLV